MKKKIIVTPSEKCSHCIEPKCYVQWLPLNVQSGAVVRALASHHCVPVSIPARCHMSWLSLLLVLLSPQNLTLQIPIWPRYRARMKTSLGWCGFLSKCCNLQLSIDQVRKKNDSLIVFRRAINLPRSLCSCFELSTVSSVKTLKTIKRSISAFLQIVCFQNSDVIRSPHFTYFHQVSTAHWKCIIL